MSVACTNAHARPYLYVCDTVSMCLWLARTHMRAPIGMCVILCLYACGLHERTCTILAIYLSHTQYMLSQSSHVCNCHIHLVYVCVCADVYGCAYGGVW
jgi:hypothetical protein